MEEPIDGRVLFVGPVVGTGGFGLISVDKSLDFLGRYDARVRVILNRDHIFISLYEDQEEQGQNANTGISIALENTLRLCLSTNACISAGSIRKACVTYVGRK
jgi:hypothetical protein